MSAGRELLLSEAEQERIAVRLVDDGLFGVRERPEDYVKLKSKRMSPHYLDIRPGISNYNTRVQVVAKSMVSLANHRAGEHYGHPNYMEDVYDYLAGTPEAFTSYATSVADFAKMGLLQPRVDTQKTSGNKTPILGKYTPGSTVAEFDDVVTDGESKVSTIKTLTAAGLVVADYFVVLDREEGGAPQVVEATGIEITPALGVSSMVVMLHELGRINQAQFDNVRRYFDQYGEAHAQELFAAA